MAHYLLHLLPSNSAGLARYRRCRHVSGGFRPIMEDWASDILGNQYPHFGVEYHNTDHGSLSPVCGAFKQDFAREISSALSRFELFFALQYDSAK